MFGIAIKFRYKYNLKIHRKQVLAAKSGNKNGVQLVELHPILLSSIQWITSLPQM